MGIEQLQREGNSMNADKPLTLEQMRRFLGLHAMLARTISATLQRDNSPTMVDACILLIDDMARDLDKLSKGG
jgi:hypothetical protein